MGSSKRTSGIVCSTGLSIFDRVDGVLQIRIENRIQSLDSALTNPDSRSVSCNLSIQHSTSTRHRGHHSVGGVDLG